MTKTPSELAEEMGVDVEKKPVKVEPARGTIGSNLSIRAMAFLTQKDVIIPDGVKVSPQRIEDASKELKKNNQIRDAVVRDRTGKYIPPFEIGRGFEYALAGKPFKTVICVAGDRQWKSFVELERYKDGLMEMDGVTVTKRIKVSKENLIKSPLNPRIDHSEKWVETLRKDIQSRGQLKDIVVRERDGVYEVGDGWARALTGLVLNAIVVEADDDAWERFILSERLQEQGLFWVDRLKAVLRSLHLESKDKEDYPGTPEKLLWAAYSVYMNKNTLSPIYKLVNETIDTVFSRLANPIKWQSLVAHDLQTWDLFKEDETVLRLVIESRLSPNKARFLPLIKQNNPSGFDHLLETGLVEVGEDKLIEIRKANRKQLLYVAKMIPYIPKSKIHKNDKGGIIVQLEEMEVRLDGNVDDDLIDVLAATVGTALESVRIKEMMG